MTETSYDIVLIGSGPAGYAAAFGLRDAGFSVCIIEKGEIGGVCLNRGCIPAKFMISASRKFYDAKYMNRYGISTGDMKFDFSVFKKNQAGIISRLKKGLVLGFKNKDITVIKGTAGISDDKHVKVETDAGMQRIGFSKLIIASGSRPFVPLEWNNIQGVINSETFWQINKLPKNIVIIGGGVIGCEYASCLSILGCNVVLIEKMDKLLSSEEPEVSENIYLELRKRNVDIYLGNEIKNIKNQDSKVVLSLSNEIEINADMAVVCIGRKRNYDKLGLELLGIKDFEKSFKQDSLKLCENVYLAGDIAKGPQLAHKGYYDAAIVVQNILEKKVTCDYTNVPIAVYTIPEISRVGLTEKEAVKKYDIVSKMMSYTKIGKAVVEYSTHGFIKIIVQKKTNIVLGITILGTSAAELQGCSLLAVKNKMTVSTLAKTYFAHPTLSEIFQHAAKSSQ
ncbi:dihydrolipoyl dehydrogenase family protein [bacterium]